MAMGDFAAAWAVSDRVLTARDEAERDDKLLPYHRRWVWDGRAFDGKRVLVRCYHGLGDTLQFCRYLTPLRRRVRHLTVEAQPELIPLLSRLSGPDRIVAFRPADPLPESECDFEIMELAHALREAPARAPYLHPEPARIGGGGLRVGVCWQSSPMWSPERSAPAALLAPLASMPGITLYSLQHGAAAFDGNGDGDGERCPDTIVETASLVAGLDVVVSVDTMVAHLAGAIGTKLCLLLTAEPDWRWRAGGTGSVWYGGVRKYRQNRPGDWETPIGSLLTDLGRAVETRAGGRGTLAFPPGS